MKHVTKLPPAKMRRELADYVERCGGFLLASRTLGLPNDLLHKVVAGLNVTQSAIDKIRFAILCNGLETPKARSRRSAS